MRRTFASLSAALLVAVLFTIAAAAQNGNPPADTLKVNYFSNANTAGAPDGTVRITDPGTAATGNVCAYIAVFDPNQEMSECCGCLLTPDGLRTLSVNSDLTSNPLTGVKLQTGVIKIVSAAPTGNACPLPGQVKGSPVLEAGLRSWATHIQNGNFAITETVSQDATLSTGEINRLGVECSAIILDGSGAGICSCGTGD